MPTNSASHEAQRSLPWSMPASEDRCPGCGRFVSIEDGFLDVAPGGVRGSDYCATYCDRACTALVRCFHGHRLTDRCDEGCE